ncbi:hypothetical protein M0R45_001139 [Rubus argutus]|uniref:Receptor ligand binding region domain-containing protein n=1 Tax=Rubus argutus TaxID=59490 RepID=A0AAW1VMG3_RUBAR
MMMNKKRTPPELIFSSVILFFLSSSISLATGQNTSIPVKVGVVLDDLESVSAKVRLSCINMALSDFYSSRGNTKTRLVLSIRDSRGDVVDAAAAALDLIKNVQVQAILGPKSSMQAKFVIDLGNRTRVPIISFSATSPSLVSLPRLPYAVNYDFIPFAYPNGTSAGTYDEMIQHVFLGYFDALAADSTIRANRARYVDFTLPYTESDFRGPLTHQVGTALWFSFSTMVFAQRERVVSNLARFVVIVWMDLPLLFR